MNIVNSPKDVTFHEENKSLSPYTVIKTNVKLSLIKYPEIIYDELKFFNPQIVIGN